MKKILIIFALQINALPILTAQSQKGSICYELNVVLKFDDKTTQQFTDPLEKFLIKAASGQKMELHYKVEFDHGISKKFQIENCETYLRNKTPKEIEIKSKNNKQKSVYRYEESNGQAYERSVEQKKINFKHTGKSKQILGFKCEEIEFFQMVDTFQIKVRAFITKQLPKSAGFETFANLNAAVLEMHTNGRSLIPKSISIDNTKYTK